MNRSDFIHVSEVLDHLKQHKVALDSILNDLGMSEKHYDSLRNEMDRMIATREFTIE
jgi:16S rRNA C1402 N4-methylase RsmH